MSIITPIVSDIIQPILKSIIAGEEYDPNLWTAGVWDDSIIWDDKKIWNDTI